jgi:hypothetical protein
MAVRVDEDRVDARAAAVAEDPLGRAPERRGCQTLDLVDEPADVVVGGLVVRNGEDQVVVDQLGDVGDGVGHRLLPLEGSWAQKDTEQSAGAREAEGRENRSAAAARTASRPCCSETS